MDYPETPDTHVWKDRIRERAMAQLSTQKDLLSAGLGNVASAARQSTQMLREREHGAIAAYVDKAADGLDRFSTRLRARSVDDIVTDVGRAARKQPALFVGTAVAIGIIGARLVQMRKQRNRAEREEALRYTPIS
jgi:ElaB/YqjD/DUF883 family membrane-anchored ribosome-binding protein